MKNLNGSDGKDKDCNLIFENCITKEMLAEQLDLGLPKSWRGSKKGDTHDKQIQS